MEARRAGDDDTDEVLRLARVMFDALAITGDDPAWEPRARARLRAGIADGTVAAFVVDRPDAHGVLVASAAVSIQQRLPTPRIPDGRAAYVQWVATDAAWRRQGLARRVMVALVAWVRDQGVRIVDLHASADGEPLYRDLGFAPSLHPELRLHL